MANLLIYKLLSVEIIEMIIKKCPLPMGVLSDAICFVFLLITQCKISEPYPWRKVTEAERGGGGDRKNRHS
jgi:hypothetical protein